MMRHVHFIPVFVAAFLGTVGPLAASDAWVWDSGTRSVAPAWIGGNRTIAGAAVDEQHFEVRGGLHPGKALAVTLFFQDGGAGMLRVLWSGPGGDLLLGDRLLEGVDMINRRTLLIPGETTAAGGRLVVQSDAGAGRLKRLALEWVVPAAFYARDEASAPYLILGDRAVDQAEAEGLPPEPREDAFRSRVTRALLQDAPVPLMDEPAFQSDITPIPGRVLFEFEIAHLAAQSPLYLWVNGKMAGPVSVEIPDLWDPGWFQEADGTARYAGWRKARVAVDPALLTVGPNLFQLEAPLAFGGGPALRRVFIQAAYEPAAPALLPVPTPPEPDREAGVIPSP